MKTIYQSDVYFEEFGRKDIKKMMIGNSEIAYVSKWGGL